MRLLTPAHANAKTAKSLAFSDKYLPFILHLAPSTLSGYHMCPSASVGCAAACLNSAGRGAFNSVQTARVNKTIHFVNGREGFLLQLVDDISAAVRQASKQNRIAVVRLNGTSDVDWTRVHLDDGRTIFSRFPAVQFYDYTKVFKRLERLVAYPIANYHVTFSRSESNDREAHAALDMGFNVAAVFRFNGDLPALAYGVPVIDGDEHDLRFLDAKHDGGAWIALKPKGRAKRDESGFVINYSTQTKVV